MSTEGDKRTNETPQEVYDRIQQYVEAAPFGSAEYQAISDYIELQTLYQRSRNEDGRILSSKDEAARLSKQREANITDFQIALLNHQISQSESRVPGYGKAYIKMVSFFESELADAVNREAVIQFPGGWDAQEKFSGNRYEEIYNKVQNAVFLKRE